MDNDKKIIFFDGHCGLCDRFVTEVFLRDQNHQFLFAPLQGPTARRVIPQETRLNTVVFWNKGKVLYKSKAALEILSALGGFYKLASVFKIFPSSVLDLVYDFVARNRYSWFGETDTCRLPSPEEKPYFLD